jgi:outer membrane biogenesis lipoprotein LolB
MKTFLATLTILAALLLPACASSRDSSEAEWQRAQCGQVIDREAREKCMRRVVEDYGRR